MLDTGHVAIPRAIFHDRSVLPQHFYVLFYLLSQGSIRDRGVRLGNETIEVKRGQVLLSGPDIEEHIGLSRSTVRDAIRALRDADYLAVEQVGPPGRRKSLVTILQFGEAEIEAPTIMNLPAPQAAHRQTPGGAPPDPWRPTASTPGGAPLDRQYQESISYESAIQEQEQNQEQDREAPAARRAGGDEGYLFESSATGFRITRKTAAEWIRNLDHPDGTKAFADEKTLVAALDYYDRRLQEDPNPRKRNAFMVIFNMLKRNLEQGARFSGGGPLWPRPGAKPAHSQPATPARPVSEEAAQLIRETRDKNREYMEFRAKLQREVYERELKERGGPAW